MTLINTAQVAELLGVSIARVERMTKESLLSKIEDSDNGPLYDQAAIERYKSFADRLGGI